MVIFNISIGIAALKHKKLNLDKPYNILNLNFFFRNAVRFILPSVFNSPVCLFLWMVKGMTIHFLFRNKSYFKTKSWRFLSLEGLNVLDMSWVHLLFKTFPSVLL